MTLRADLYWSFRSPYSYLAIGRYAEVAASQAALEAAGHWGVPTLVFDGEPFFGQDRIDLALWRLKQAGLAPRSVE